MALNTELNSWKHYIITYEVKLVNKANKYMYTLNQLKITNLINQS